MLRICPLSPEKVYMVSKLSNVLGVSQLPYWWRYDNNAVRDTEAEAFVLLTHRTSTIE